VSAERLYYANSFLRRFPAQVTALRPSPAAEGGAVWQIALNRTAFYPTSGGQPFDTGCLRVAEDGGRADEAAVESVVEDEAGEIWHAVRRPLAVGTAVEGEIAWDRRLDHMQQHTGQHLLSAVCLSELQAPTVSFHLGETISNIDLAASPPSDDALARVELAANRIIAEDRPVSARVVTRAEAEALIEAGTLRKLPQRSGDLRLIEIAACDLNACGGTHLRSTGQIGGLWLRGVEKIARGARLHFACGLRAVRAGRGDAALLGQAAAALSVSAGDVPAAVERLKADAKMAGKSAARFGEQLAAVLAERLAAGGELRNGVRIVAAASPERDRDFLRRLASRIADAPRTVAILSAADPPAGRVVLARSRDLAFHCGEIMQQALAERGARGGGSAEWAQADVAAGAAAELHAALAARVRALLV
jgi:alanyl-tRNA synthetase